mgnify:CR=1 FL=1|tara:strand:+ start:774 stop:1439 length:666 start_codon:yes stop_codon:yes gene_type:complete
MNTRILIIGAGGIGSLVVDNVSRAFAFSGLFKQVGKLEMTLMDGDVVESRNLPHQQFSHGDQTMPKVAAIQKRFEALGMPIENTVELVGIAKNFSAEADICKYDLVVVAVDREEPRTLVHSNAKHWLDLRARGDGFVMWSHKDPLHILDRLPKLPEGTSTSCQLDEAVESGNIQFGFALAAAHGAQWIIQWLRGANPPPGKMYSIHMGELPLPEITPGLIE